MATIKDEAQAYEPPQTRNIADLQVVPTDIEIFERRYKEGTLQEFRIKVVRVNGEDYRVPVSVFSSLKTILEERPDLQTFKVKKSGAGKHGTVYTLIPLSYGSSKITTVPAGGGF